MSLAFSTLIRYLCGRSAPAPLSAFLGGNHGMKALCAQLSVKAEKKPSLKPQSEELASQVGTLQAFLDESYMACARGLAKEQGGEDISEVMTLVAGIQMTAEQHLKGSKLFKKRYEAILS